MKNVYKLHGLPKPIGSDRYPIFTSKFWVHLFKLMGTQLAYSTAYYPLTNDQTEIVNKGLETYLRCFTSHKLKIWAQWLYSAEWCYNTSYQVTIKMTPLKPMYGRDPPKLN